MFIILNIVSIRGSQAGRISSPYHHAWLRDLSASNKHQLLRHLQRKGPKIAWDPGVNPMSRDQNKLLLNSEERSLS